jgi:NitT/TauT family transport system permease protein
MQPTDGQPTGRRNLARELAGLDALELPIRPRIGGAKRFWEGLWPKLAAAAILLSLWQLVVLAGLKPAYLLPGPLTVFPRLFEELAGNDLLVAITITLRRAAIGFALALALGVFIGLAIVGSKRLRTAVASLITGLQTMPSIAWFPLAILIFGLSEAAILFVVIMGAAPAIANGLIAGVDTIPRLLHRAGRVLGARGWNRYRFIVLPAALPNFVGGLKQGWAFSWRSLMAGELLVLIGTQPSIGVQLSQSRELVDTPWMLSMMLVILIIGILVDAVFFGNLEKAVRRRWGLAEV